MKQQRLSLAIAGALWASALATPAALAQQAAQDDGAVADEVTRLDTVTVTARRRSESIQDVPVAVSAFGESELRDLQAVNIDGLQGAVPNMNIVQGRGSANSVNVFIRGIGQPDALQTFDPGVGMYVDDVYYSRINGALFSLFDVQQVEVLRGPQGTLYGKNSTGGAIKIATKNPFDDEGGAIELTAGDHGRAEGRFYVGGALSDTVAGSLAGGWIGNDGYVRDALSGKHYNDDETRAIRGKLAFQPTEGFRATFSFDHTKQNAALTLGHPVAPLVQTDLASLSLNLLMPQQAGDYDYRARTSFAPGQGQRMNHGGASLALEWDLGESWRFKSISAYRQLETRSFIDIDASEYELGDVLVALDQDQASQEFQLHYDNGRNLHATFGAYYMKEDVPSHQEAYADDLFVNGGVPVGFLRTIDDDLSTTSVAAFAHLNWEFAPTWTLAAGARWTRDEKDYYRTTSTFWESDSLYYLAAFGLYLPFSALNETVALDTNKSWTAWTPSISLQKAFGEHAMGYVSANRGFKSGGFNGRANSAAEAGNPDFDPEFVWTYEAGLKLQSADRRLSGNFTVFRSEYKDFQARVSEIVDPDSATPGFTFPVLNAAKLGIDGVEFEGVALLGQATRLSAQVGWMDARYDEFDDPRVQLTPGLAGLHDHVPFSPEWTARVALQHTFALGDSGAFTLGGDLSYRSETWLSVDNRPELSQDAYTLAGLYGVWDSPQYTWQVRAGVRNLTDEKYRTEGQEFSSVGNIQTVYFGWPRNYYVSVRYNF